MLTTFYARIASVYARIFCVYVFFSNLYAHTFIVSFPIYR